MNNQKTQLSILMVVLNEVEHDNRVLKCAKFLQQMGHEVNVFGVSNDRSATAPAAKKVSGITIRLFPNPRFLLKSAKILGFNFRSNIHHLLATIWIYVERLQPHVIHTHDFNTMRIGKELVQRLRRDGSDVYWIHDFHEYVKGLTSIDDDIRKLGLQDQDEAIWMQDDRLTVSPYLSEALRRDYGLRTGPKVLLNTNTRSAYDPHYGPTIRRVLGLAPTVPLAVYTGGVSKPRGVHTLVAALAKVPGLHVALVTNNTGAYVDSLQAAAAESGCTDRLHLLPYVKPDEVPSFIQDATVGVHPMVHFENAEVALPNKLFDYCLGRIPSVVSDCRAMSEFVTQWGVGEVFRAEDADDLAGAISKVIANRQQYVENITRDGGFLERFSWETQCSVLGDIYSRAAAEIASSAAEEDVTLPRPSETAQSHADSSPPPISPEVASLPAAQPAPSIPGWAVTVQDQVPEAVPVTEAQAAQASETPRQEPVTTEGTPDGAFEGISGTLLTGWALDRSRPDRPVTVSVYYRHQRIVSALADYPHHSPALPGGAGPCGFRILLPKPFFDGKERRMFLRIEPWSHNLAGSPFRVRFDPSGTEGQEVSQPALGLHTAGPPAH